MISFSDGTPVTERQTCDNSYYKCCPDGVTFARGPNYEGCQQSESGAGTQEIKIHWSSPHAIRLHYFQI